MKTIGHHTVENRNNDEFIIKNAPFFSKSKSNYLGNGFYFWDNNIEYANRWGQLRYNNNYCICETNINAEGKSLLDLVGDRDDIIYFKELIKKFKIGKWSVADIINYLVIKNKELDFLDIFPYDIIRVEESKQNERFIFSKNNHGITYLDCIYIICIKNNLKKYISNIRIIYKSKI